MKRIQFHLAFAFLLSMSLPVVLIGQGSSAPVIVSATIDYTSSPWQLTISGRNFKPARIDPTIYFGDAELASLLSVSDTSVVASLPLNPPAGTYLLTVTNSKRVSGTGYVTFGAAGPPGEGSDQPVEWNVNCDTNPPGSVNAALGEAGNRASRTTITIRGFCNEDVGIDRGNLTFRAAEGSLDAGFNWLSLNLGAQGIKIENLRIAHGLSSVEGASFRAENLTVDDPGWLNVHVGNSVSSVLVNPTLTNCHSGCIEVGGGGNLFIYGGNVGGGISVLDGGSADMFGTHIRGSGLNIGNGSTVYLDSVIIEESAGPGIYAAGSVTLYHTTIRNNDIGIGLEPGGFAEVTGGSKILGNGWAGINVRPGSIAHITDSEISHNSEGIFAIAGSLTVERSHISYNDSYGIAVRSTSSLSISDSWIEGNGGDGIWLEDLTFMETGGEAVHLINNGGAALRCPPGPIAQQYTDYAPLDMSGNGDTIDGCTAAPK